MIFKNRLKHTKNTKIDVLFLTIPFFPTRSPPVNIASLVGYLNDKMIVDVLDLNVQAKERFSDLNHLWGNCCGIIEKRESNNLKQVNEYLKKCIDQYFEKHTVKYIAIPYYDLNLDLISELAKHIKQRFPKTKTIIGGAGILDNYEDFQKDVFDYVVQGDGEIAIEKICKTKITSRIIKNDRVDLQKITFLDYRLFALEKYEDKKHLYLYTSKGCIHRCPYCIDHFLAFPYRKRNITDITKEIQYYYEHHGIDQFTFTDLLINADLTFLKKLAINIFNLNLPIHWSSYFTIRDGMDEELFSLLKKSGCNGVHFGFETASNKVLKKMGKRYTQDMELKCLKIAHAQLPTYINLMIGYPGEDEQAFQETLSFLKKNNELITAVASILPFSIIPKSYVALHKKDFEISNYNGSDQWNEHNNTYAERLRRIEVLKELLQKIQLPLVINYEVNCQ